MWWAYLDMWLSWASAICCNSTTFGFSLHGCVIQAAIGGGYLASARTRGKELRRIQEDEAAGNPFGFLYHDMNSLETSAQTSLPRVAVVMPLKGVGEFNIGNWRTQVTTLYGGGVDFFFVVESTEDPAFDAVSRLLKELGDQVSGRVIVAGMSRTCSQKVHNQLAGVEAMHKDTKYVLFLDDDVRMHPGTIGSVVRHMEENPKIFVTTGFPFDILTQRCLKAYCIFEYHMPCSIGFGASGGQTFFLWGGFMMMHADDFRNNRYGLVTGLRYGGYSDDMTLAAVAAANKRIISSPPDTIFFHPLGRATFKQYWNYLRKQSIVLETHITTVNYLMNRALFYTHCWLSWGLCFPYLTSLIHLLVILRYFFTSNPDFSPDIRTGVVVICCTITSSLIEVLSMKRLSRVETDLCNALSPESTPVSIQPYDWFLVFLSTIISNFMYPFAAITSMMTQHINWSGVDYYFHNGKMCRIERRKKKVKDPKNVTRTKNGAWDANHFQSTIVGRLIQFICG
ncbi:hypothetical protein R1sor_021163 [Riccia sorocarpa]|uniref:ceramide glucosyltransferase n=1 Tax=Riccia sorocarpa TaxID=122646 RepID=A0ABD3GI22_9MARC